MKSNAHVSVVLLISNLEYGGAQRQVVELANHIDPARFDVYVCSLSEYVPLASELRDRARRLQIISKRWKFDLTVVTRLARLLRKLKADVVHAYLFDAIIAARLAGRLAGTPVIVGSERNTDYTLKRRQLIAYRLTRGCVDLVIANSHSGAAFNRRVLGNDPSCYCVVHNGVDVTRFVPRDSGAVRRELGIAESDLVVGTFASFKEQKNYPMLFAAAQRVLERFPQTRLLLVGDELYAGMHGSDLYKRRMDQLVDELGIRDRCLFLGNRSDVANLYCACDVTVLPSLFEGTPNVVLESMACGVPVIVTDVSDNRMIAPDGRVGYVVPLGNVEALADRISGLLGDQALRRKMGSRARDWVVQEYSTSRLAAKTEAVYRAALNGRIAVRRKSRS